MILKLVLKKPLIKDLYKILSTKKLEEILNISILEAK